MEKRVEKESIEGKDVLLIPDKASADKMLTRLKKEPYLVTNVERKRRNVTPFLPLSPQHSSKRQAAIMDFHPQKL